MGVCLGWEGEEGELVIKRSDGLFGDSKVSGEVSIR